MMFSKNSCAAIVLSVAVAFSVAACQGSTDQDDAKSNAQDFMNAYYQQGDLELAIDFTDGAARQKLQTEIETAKEAETVSRPRGPGVEIELEGQNESSSAQIMQWSVRSTAGETLQVETASSKVDDGWKVTEFTEKQVE